MRKATTHEAKTHLSRILAEVEAGEETWILRGAVPVARLLPVSAEVAPRTRPRVGTVTSGPVHVAPDAFAPLDGA